MQRWVAAVILCATAAAVLAAQPPDGGKPDKPSRKLPGVEPDGSIRLHNTWALKPAGKQVELGDFPVNIALHPAGSWAAILHAGYGEHEVIVVDLKAPKQHVVSRTSLKQAFYGLCFAPDGKTVFASGGEHDVVHAFDFSEGYLSNHRELAVPKGSFVGGVAVDADDQLLAAAGTWGHVVTFVERILALKGGPVQVALEAKSYPYTCLFDKVRQRVYVSLWAKAKIAVIDVAKLGRETATVVAHYATDPHPTEMALSPDAKYLYVACANSTKVSVLNADDGKGLQTIATSLYPPAPVGNTPCSLSLTPDGQILFVANADNNNVAVFNVTDPKAAKPLGFIPVGYHPTSVRYNWHDKRIYVANARGTTPKANRHGPNPLAPPNQAVREYI